MQHLTIPYQPEDGLERQTKRQRRTNTRKRKATKMKAKQEKNKSTYNMDLYFFKNNTSHKI